jgi:hypothetical protein
MSTRNYDQIYIIPIRVQLFAILSKQVLFQVDSQPQ